MNILEANNIIEMPKDKSEIPKELEKDLYAYILNHTNIDTELNKPVSSKPVYEA